MKIQVFDKVKWHYPDGKNCPDLAHAMRHFKELAGWLQNNSLLSAYGQEVIAEGIDSEFSLTSEMLTETGNRVLGARYQEWLNTLDYAESCDFRLLTTELQNIS